MAMSKEQDEQATPVGGYIVRPVRYAQFVLALATAAAVGCGDAPTAETGDGPPDSISLNTSTIEIFPEETQSLMASVRDADGNVLSVSRQTLTFVQAWWRNAGSRGIATRGDE